MEKEKMADQGNLEITLLSGSCCNPSLVQTEKDLEKRLALVIRELGLHARVKLVSLSEVLAGKGTVTEEQAQLIQAMFQRYGARLAPAAMIGKRFLFAGGSPSNEKLADMLKTVQPTEPARPVERPRFTGGCGCGGGCCEP